MTEFSVIMPLQGIAQWDNWLEGVSLKVTNYMENKNGRNKKYMETLIVLWIKCTDMLKKKKKKTQRRYRCCSSYGSNYDAIPSFILKTQENNHFSASHWW